MIKLKQIAGACAATAMLAAAVPAFAQSSTTPSTSNTTQTTDRAYTTDTRKDDTNWGWIGLLGLAGLMGMKRANHDDNQRRTSTNSGPTPGRA